MMLRNRERGANIVETALVLPLLLLLLAGILDVGRAYYTYITIYNSAREGGRYAFSALASDELSPIPGDVQAAIVQHVQLESQGTIVDLTDTDRATITVEGNHADDPSGSVRVTVEYAYNTLMGGILGWDGTLRTHVVFPVRQS